jgi:hypothetical protein
LLDDLSKTPMQSRFSVGVARDKLEERGARWAGRGRD